MSRSIDDIENELHELQGAYLDEEDEVEQMKIVSKFTALLQEATGIDGVDRVAANVTINNWTREDSL